MKPFLNAICYGFFFLSVVESSQLWIHMHELPGRCVGFSGCCVTTGSYTTPQKRATATSATARINVNILFKGDKLC